MSRYVKIVLVVVGLYLISNSFYGLWVFFDNFMKIDFISAIQQVFLILPVYLFALIVSILFFVYLNDYKKLNQLLVYFYILQGLQIFHFRIYSFGIYVLFGSHLDIGFCSFCADKLYFDTSFFDNAVLLFTSESNYGYIISVNFVPIAMIYLIRYMQKNLFSDSIV